MSQCILLQFYAFVRLLSIAHTTDLAAQIFYRNILIKMHIKVEFFTFSNPEIVEKVILLRSNFRVCDFDDLYVLKCSDLKNLFLVVNVSVCVYVCVCLCDYKNISIQMLL